MFFLKLSESGEVLETLQKQEGLKWSEKHNN